MGHSINGQRLEDAKAIIRAEARRQGFDENLAVAVATVESGLNPSAVGTGGDIGLFQLYRPNASEVARQELFNPYRNAREGIRELIYWQKECPQKEARTFVICYNQGARHPRYPKLHPYYKKVIAALSSL